MKHIVTMMFLVFGSAAVAQEMYTCRIDGKKVFQDRPCGKAAEKVTLRGYVPAPPAAPKAVAAPDEAKPAEAPKAEPRPKAKPVEDKRGLALDQAAREERLAKRCVDKYRPHLAYPNGVKINGHRLQRDGFGETVFVYVRTITNPNTPAGYDPITLNETFKCRTDGGDGIDDRHTEDDVERHKRGIRTDTQ